MFLFDIPRLENELAELEKETSNPDFWNNSENTQKVLAKIKKIKSKYTKYKELEKEINNLIELAEMVKIEYDEELAIDVTNNYKKQEKNLEKLELETLFSGKYDSNNAIVTIHPGAGGTESCDWASMLARMYERFCEKEGYKWEIVDEQKGDEAGIKSITLKISGDYAYGYLKKEDGVHRLVRISPFDAGARRHTSFASVSIMPEIKKEINIEIKEEDLKIDVYHSSGAGGQSVNTSNSAVRITHLPTKTVVTCQNERSQLNNKEQAMKMLKNKLYMIEFEKEQAKLNALKGDNSSINFGSQIRSYILEPYKMVKDHRSNYQSNEPEKILDGNIKEMLVYNLKELR